MLRESDHEPNNVIVTSLPQHLHSRFHRPAFADEINDGLGTLPTRQVLDFVHETVIVPRLDDVVCAELLGQIQGVRVLIDDDQSCCADGFHDLDADVAEAAGADADAEVTWPEDFGGFGGGVIGC